MDSKLLKGSSPRKKPKQGCFPSLGLHCPLIPKVFIMYQLLLNVQYMNLPLTFTSSTLKVSLEMVSKKSRYPSGGIVLYLLDLPAKALITLLPTTNGLIRSALNLTSTPSGMITYSSF